MRRSCRTTVHESGAGVGLAEDVALAAGEDCDVPQEGIRQAVTEAKVDVHGALGSQTCCAG